VKGNGGSIFSAVNSTLGPLEGVEFHNSHAKFGGALYSGAEGVLSLRDVEFGDNGGFVRDALCERGGAVYLQAGNASIENSRFRNNAAAEGGAIFSEAPYLEVQHVDFNGNTGYVTYLFAVFFLIGSLIVFFCF
jgi:hypothetical protein